MASQFDEDTKAPDFVSYTADDDCTNDDWHAAPGGSLWDAGFIAGDSDPDGSIPDVGALGGPGAADVPWWDDADNDGFLAAADCNDNNSDLNPDTVWYADTDRDGLGDRNNTAVGCIPPSVDWVLDDTDCDDGDPTVGGPLTWYLDADGDGHGDPSHSIVACEPPEGYVADATDCNDDDEEAFPGQVWADRKHLPLPRSSRLEQHTWGLARQQAPGAFGGGGAPR